MTGPDPEGEQGMDSQTISPKRIILKGAKTLLSAVELGVFTALANGAQEIFRAK